MENLLPEVLETKRVTGISLLSDQTNSNKQTEKKPDRNVRQFYVNVNNVYTEGENHNIHKNSI